MSATGMNWLADTTTLLSVSGPLAGSVAISTANKLLAGVSFGSLKPKSATTNVYVVSSSTAIVLLAPAGTDWPTAVGLQDVQTSVPSLDGISSASAAPLWRGRENDISKLRIQDVSHDVPNFSESLAYCSIRYFWTLHNEYGRFDRFLRHSRCDEKCLCARPAQRVRYQLRKGSQFLTSYSRVEVGQIRRLAASGGIPMSGQAKGSTKLQETFDSLLIRAEADTSEDQRSVARIPFFRPVSIELDDRSYSGFCRDLSTASIGLLHSIALPLRDVNVIIPIATNRKCKMLVHIERCEPVWRGMVYQRRHVCRHHARRSARRRTA